MAAGEVACPGTIGSPQAVCSGIACAGDGAADALASGAESGAASATDASAVTDALSDLEAAPGRDAEAGACTMALDPSFGSGGVATLDVPPNPGPASVAIQPDGKILVTGDTTPDAVVVARYDTTGAADPTFGAGGFVSLAAVTGMASGAGLAVQPDGKIVVLGSGTDSQNAFVWQLARLNADGSLDTTFGASGFAPSPMMNPVTGVAVALARDGSILAAGVVRAGSAADFVLAKYDSGGALDTAFGVGGSVTTSFGSSFFVGRILVQPDDKVLLGAQSRVARDATVEHDIALSRFTSDGAPDLTFGVGGTQTTSLGQGQYIVAGMVLQSTGAIVVSANTAYANNRFVLLRYTPAGALDTTFGNAGVVETDFFGRGEYASGLSLLPADALVAAGTVPDPTSAAVAHYFGFALYDANGQLDPTRAPSGELVTLVPGQTYQTLFAQALDPDGRLVVAAYATRMTDSGSTRMLDLARYGCP